MYNIKLSIGEISLLNKNLIMLRDRTGISNYLGYFMRLSCSKFIMFNR